MTSLSSSDLVIGRVYLATGRPGKGNGTWYVKVYSHYSGGVNCRYEFSDYYVTLPTETFRFPGDDENSTALTRFAFDEFFFS